MLEPIKQQTTEIESMVLVSYLFVGLMPSPLLLLLLLLSLILNEDEKIQTNAITFWMGGRVVVCAHSPLSSALVYYIFVQTLQQRTLQQFQHIHKSIAIPYLILLPHIAALIFPPPPSPSRVLFVYILLQIAHCDALKLKFLGMKSLFFRHTSTGIVLCCITQYTLRSEFHLHTECQSKMR